MKIILTEGNEIVELRIYCRTSIKLQQPVVGFSIRNQRGLELISDNTYITYKDTMLPTILPGENFYASFKFMLPYLKPGNYTIGGAIADGVPGMHIQHHRRDEALNFKVHASHIIYGLFGVPIIALGLVPLLNQWGVIGFSPAFLNMSDFMASLFAAIAGLILIIDAFKATRL